MLAQGLSSNYMKTYRLQNDTRWNYGIRVNPSSYLMRGTSVHIFFFRQDSSVGNGAMYSVDHGFSWSFEYQLPRFIKGSFRSWFVTSKRLRNIAKK